VSTPIFKKICLLGDFAVGKTSLVRRFVDNQFSDEYLSTIGVKISRKLVEVPTTSDKSPSVQMILWDLEGTETYLRHPDSYLQGASGAVIVCDITRRDTIVNANKHMLAYLSHNPRGHIVVATNKADLLQEQTAMPILPLEGNQIIATAMTSAKTGLGVSGLFETLATKLLE
jgi:small GTP-binding protein